MHHDAFISYSHVDSAIAREFERGLENLAKPLLKLRALDVFRDETSLSASPGLWASIVEHLSGSEWLLILCSPHSAASVWCAKEIEWWLANRSANRILILLTEGELVWSSENQDFDYTRTNVLPSLMRAKFPEEPLFTDLRWARNQSTLGLTNPRFRDAVLNVAATLRGIPKDELDGADVRQLRRNKLFVRSLFTMITLAAILAVWQWYQATQQRDAAREQARIATSRKLVADSLTADASLDSKLLTAAEAYQVAPTREAHQNLIRLLHENDRAKQILFGHTQKVYALAFSQNGSRLASVDDDGYIILWDRIEEGLKTVFHRSPFFIPKGLQYPKSLLFNSSSDRLIATYVGGDSMVFNLKSPELNSMALGECLGGKGADVTISLDGSKAVVRAQDGALILWELGASDPCVSSVLFEKQGARQFKLNQSGNRVAVVDEDGRVSLWDIDGGSKRIRSIPEIRYPTNLLLGLQNKVIAAFTPDGTLNLWDVSSSTQAKLVFSHQYSGQITSLKLGPNDDSLAIGFADGSADLWRWSGGKVSRDSLPGHRYNYHIVDVAFNHDGHLLATAGEDGLVVLWYLGEAHDKPLPGELRGTSTAIKAIAFDPNRNQLASTSWDAIILWNAAVDQDHPILPYLKRNEDIWSYSDVLSDKGVMARGFILSDADKNACGLVSTARFIAGRNLTAEERQTLVGTLEYVPTCKNDHNNR